MEEFKVITQQDCKIWNQLVQSFSDWDIYYLAEYAKSMENHGDGESLLFYFSTEGKKLCCIAMKRDIGECILFGKLLEKGKYFDMETPYGYGGPLTEGEFGACEQLSFFSHLKKYCLEQRIVSYFLRFHPILNNTLSFCEIAEIKTTKNTVVIDTSDPQIIDTNLNCKNRNMIRKAIRSGITIEKDKGQKLDEFCSLYLATMKRNGAELYYYFDKFYFDYLINHMSDHTVFFYAIYEGKPIGASIFLFNENYMHYHLSGSMLEYKNLAPMNLLLYEAALWANTSKISKFHLGGGMSAEDTLFRFKKQFNKLGQKEFYIGRMIFDKEGYEHLLYLRKKKNTDFDMMNSFMIQYRSI